MHLSHSCGPTKTSERTLWTTGDAQITISELLLVCALRNIQEWTDSRLVGSTLTFTRIQRFIQKIYAKDDMLRIEELCSRGFVLST